MTVTTAAVAREVGSPFSIEALELEQPRSDEVRVRLVAVGICHTDVNCRNQVYDVRFPIVLGHKGASVVEEIGESVEGLAIGDHVVLGYSSCGHCEQCRGGHPAFCPEVFSLNLLGNRADGSSAFAAGVRSHFFGQYSSATRAVVPARNIARVPVEAPLDLLGPLGCGIQTGAGAVLRSLKVHVGSSLVIFGAGAVGLSALMAGMLAGAYPIVVVDRIASRLELARELGATATVDAGAGEPVEEIRRLTAGGADFAIEAAGAPPAFRQAVAALGPRGMCGLVGAVGAGVEGSFDWLHVQMNGITIRGVIEGDSIPADFIPELVDLQRRGKFPLEKLVRFYDFDEINQAIEDAEEGGVVKPILRMPSA